MSSPWANILRRSPDQITTDYTSSHAGRGADYDDNFDRLPFRRMLWELEQTALTRLLTSTAARLVVDVACGTGRIAEVVARVLPDADVLGVDVAESMLERARRRVPTAQFVRGDVRRLVELVPEGSVDLVTAFRFFANADGPLRTEAMNAIADVVRPGGFLLLNNHRNFWSPSYVARRARSGTAPGARNGDILHPLQRLGFHVIDRRSLGIAPHTDGRAYVLSLSMAAAVERTNLRLLSGRHSLGTDTLWLLQRRNGAASKVATETRLS